MAPSSTAPEPPAYEPAQAPLPSFDAYRHRRAMRFLYERTKVGPVYYALATLITAAVGDYFSPLRAITYWPLLAFAVIWHLRRAHTVPPEPCSERQARTWWQHHWWLIHAACGVWCVVLYSVGQIEQSLSPPMFIASLATIALGTAACEIATAEWRNPAAAVLVLQAPALLAFWLQFPGLRSLALTLFIYCTYLLGTQLRRRVAEFDVGMKLEHDLLTHRAELDRMTRLDALTGLANRREYQSVLSWAWNNARRTHAPLSLLVADLDHFKTVNDHHGHSGGDACLKHVAQTLQAQFRRSTDLVARIGGEEFVALLPGVVEREAIELAERCRKALESSPTHHEGHSIALTISVGVGAVDWRLDQSAEAFFSRVDAACYEAKRGGRNRVVVATLASAAKEPDGQVPRPLGAEAFNRA
jgi:diguanylate cyclase (GGDEF)-like protein